MDDPQDEKGQSPKFWTIEEEDDSCDHCTRDAVRTENGTNLCEAHFQEYQVRNS
jgi:hypothetical protein